MGQIHLPHFKHFCYIENAKVFDKIAKEFAKTQNRARIEDRRWRMAKQRSGKKVRESREFMEMLGGGRVGKGRD